MFFNQKFSTDNLISDFKALSVVFPDFEAYQLKNHPPGGYDNESIS